ncbi:MAG: hypothetical protein NZ901_01205 [Geminocystis sp.]|nr:hypothetical protein [Geminocystis sp.]HIK36706.1 hypothetical protein [Geminocystis sp. M7585_C2015_104]MCS7146785.1 hypothetical protein [Geminocystis sp.]MCX8077065.1 hypothetical protein [Geminocystis sp.]MDW8115611.1 hypothetical protein [Geminocystis sp.]
MNAKFNQKQIGLIEQQARLLMADNRQRRNNRHATMLERASQQIGLQ